MLLNKPLNQVIKLLTLFLLMQLSGCSNEQVYETFRGSERQKCEQLPPAEHDECMSELEETYEKYRRQREDSVENPRY